MQMMWAMMAPGEPLAYWVSASVMWAVMMVAMMIPAAAPMLSVYRQIYRGPRAEIAALMFACGYLASWTLFSLLAAGLQWLLHSRGVLHGHLLETGAEITAWLLIATGTYQLTPFKEACLARCRSPIGYFMGHWREGPAGGWWLGWRHGLFCIGCCWMLMLLMFAGGAMSVLTMAMLCAFIIAERVLPAGPWSARLPGVLLIAWGGWMLWEM